MAPVLRLYSLCLTSVFQMLKDACDALGTKYGYFDVEACRRDAITIREFISCNILPDTMEDIYNKFNWMDVEYDFRIWAVAIMHADMKTLKVFYGDKGLNKFNPRLENFWIDLLRHSKNLVSLDLLNVCTDRTLQVVSQHCPLLEYIQINPATVAVDGISRDLVTDVGLRHLSKCKMLKTIGMQGYRSRKMSVTLQGLRELVKSLPVINCILYDHMGRVISNGMDDVKSLPITHICETDPKVYHIEKLTKLCKNVKHLSLYFRYPKSYLEDDIAVLDAIANNTLRVPDIKVSNCRNGASLIRLISAKGQFLTGLTLSRVIISANLIQIIGTNCTTLRCLRLFEHLENNLNVNVEDLTLDDNMNMFSKLEILRLEGYYWNAQNILTTILPNSRKLEYLRFCREHNKHKDYMDKTINKILMKNPLNNLVEFDTNFSLYIITVKYFADLPDLRVIRFSDCLMTPAEKQYLKKEMKNRDISINEKY